MKTLRAICTAAITTALMGCLVSVGPFAFGVGSNARSGESLPANPESGSRYRNPNDGMELVFDGERSLYHVPDLPGHYYHEGTYYRRRTTTWTYSSHLDGPWRPTDDAELPHGLR